MARDYAQRKPAARQAKSGSGVPGWVWALCGLSLGLCVAVVVYIAQGPRTSEATPVAAEPPQPATKAGPGVPPPTKPRFKFYDLLPRFEVKPNQEAYKVEPRPSSVPHRGPYIVQAGSFAQPQDAERRKASIALLGLESQIQKVTVSGQGLRYRVQIGPVADLEQAQRTMRRLAESSIDSFASRVDG